MRIARTIGPRRPADQATQDDGRDKDWEHDGGRRKAASRTTPSAISFVSGLRRCSQLSPATK